MQSKKSSTFIAIIFFILGTLIGSGAIWKIEETKMNRLKSTSELQKQLEEQYHKIISLTEEYFNIYDDKVHPKEDKFRKIAYLKSELELIKKHFVTLEKELSNLENRTPRYITLDFFVPSAVPSIRVR